MSVLTVETEINVAPEICFDLIRNVNLNLQIGEKTSEKSAGEETHGKIAAGEIVTFSEKRFGLTQKLTVRVTEFEKPFRFTDEMIAGNFKSFKHIHEFIPYNNGTLLRDTLVWSSPLGILGKIADQLLLKNYLRKTVARRNAKLKHLAENKNLREK